ncbi:MAG: DegV family protein [Lachnospiraceae bacterium]|nr:DegV family protein [Lachnospiraceae bacterium]
MFKVIIDSCGELFPEMLADERFVNVPLTLEVDGEVIMDDESFDQLDFIRKVKASPTGPKSSCPSPGKYLEAIQGEADHVYIVTLSSEMSGSYNSALTAKEMYEEEHEDKKIHVFDSRSASVGQTLIGQKAAECEEKGMSFGQVVEAVEAYISQQHTFFVLETLDTLRKNGRLSNFKERIANTLHIKQIMAATDTGNIMKLAQVRGMGKALSKMADCMIEMTKNYGEKMLAISHCNCLERALQLKKEVEKRANFKQIKVISMRGVSTMYANDGGLIMVV